MGNVREVLIPADLYAAAENKFAESFRTVDELVAFVLQELVNDTDSTILDRADQALVEQRLKDLGYM